MENRHNEYGLLWKKADQILMAGLKHDFFLSVQPSFGNHISWSVSQDDVIHEVIWDKSFDSNRFFNPLAGLKHGWHTEPTIITRTIPIDLQFNLLMEKGRKLKLPHEDINIRGIVLDGISWILKFSGVGVTWNVHVEAWLPLINWAESVYSFLRVT